MRTFNFQHEFDKLSTYLKGFAYRLTNDYHLSEDLYQDTALMAYRHQEKFKAGSNLRAWACTIMKNKFINNFRKKQRGLNIQDTFGKNYIFDSNITYSTSNLGEHVLLGKELKNIVNSLKEDLKRPFLMYYMGYKYEEISKSLNLPLGTVKSKIFLARKELKTKVKAHYNIKYPTELYQS